MRIDAHQHFWNYDPARHEWINEEMKAIQRDFAPEQLLPSLKHHKIDGTVAVQVDQTEEETAYLLQIAAQTSFVKGVVGWIDLSSPHIEERLEYHSQFRILKGFRHIVQAEPDGFLLQPSFCHGISQLQQFGYTYDILVYENQLKDVLDFVAKFPRQPFIVDHVAKPKIKDQKVEPWKKWMTELGRHGNVMCKLSGMVTEASWTGWKALDFRPYLDTVLEAFGPSRLVYGSDWPVCLLAGTYQSQYDLTSAYLSPLSESEKGRIMGENAVQFYHL